MIDLRSDTVTKPTDAMRAAMATAEVGDDMFGEDPTVAKLEATIAKRLGKERALFVPSGSMGNLLGIRVHCGPGDEFLAEESCHILRYEQGSYAQVWGVAVQAIPGQRGILEPEQLVDRIRRVDMHCAQTRLVCLENTHNYGGGTIQPIEAVQEICQWAATHGLKRHLDGARLFNAVVATGIAAKDWAQHFDTVSVCFSKGLGAPVGSALCGTAEHIERARWHRKALGGAMRQAGILAAGALYGLENHTDRLAEDHANALTLAQAISEAEGLTLAGEVQTNLVFFDVDERLGTAEQFNAKLAERGVLMFDVAPQKMRAVTHLGVTAEEVRQAGGILKELSR
ncbi:threonine aldolase family protein [Adhaeretor mobilis]|uniref:L-allo-threonine aldolase n=1 Tax=Adhaeretor mobilis TaxID=1930276 RepID=A0A517MYY8_9BACT|nr:GntG family PLP-dependent aldolase [Adhaeretor mobilis]QDT00087.1 L-allo-threonine aldolase [Adhaeretor mobilis]